MSALEVQQLLARLYTDPGMLEEFLTDREGFCATYANGCGELLRQIDSGQLEFFAVSLRAKRSGEVKKLLPMTVQALGSRFAEEFEQYAATTIASGDRKHLADAMAFCECLLEHSESFDDLTLESAAFELLDFKVRFDLKKDGSDPVVVEANSGRRPWLWMKRFAYELPALTGCDCVEHARSNRLRLALFARLPGLRGIWYW
jgi:hypothetical protein